VHTSIRPGGRSHSEEDGRYQDSRACQDVCRGRGGSLARVCESTGVVSSDIYIYTYILRHMIDVYTHTFMIYIFGACNSTGVVSYRIYIHTHLYDIYIYIYK